MSRVLIAGIGNVFFGDDGFGVEVANRLSRSTLPRGVTVADFGIRGVHLVFELFDPPDLLVILDAVPRGAAPGTLVVLEPTLDALSRSGPAADAHGMDLPRVLESVEAMGGRLPPIRLIGCEPAELGERMGLSTPVAAAIEPAAELALSVARGWMSKEEATV